MSILKGFSTFLLRGAFNKDTLFLKKEDPSVLNPFYMVKDLLI